MSGKSLEKQSEDTPSRGEGSESVENKEVKRRACGCIDDGKVWQVANNMLFGPGIGLKLLVCRECKLPIALLPHREDVPRIAVPKIKVAR